jgi:hypothetical protein
MEAISNDGLHVFCNLRVKTREKAHLARPPYGSSISTSTSSSGSVTLAVAFEVLFSGPRLTEVTRRKLPLGCAGETGKV